MKNVENLLVNGVSFASRAEAARHFGINPKLVTERMTKRGWTLEQALELEPSPSRTFAKKVVIDGTEYASMRQAAKELGVAQSTLMNRLKAGHSVDAALSQVLSQRIPLRGQEKPVLYCNQLYASVRALLEAIPELQVRGDMAKSVTYWNDKARRAKNKGDVLNLTLRELAECYQLEPVLYVDEFPEWAESLFAVGLERDVAGVFYEVRPIE
ncbi:hypothetical protein ACPV5Y_13665 [Vibrio alfacsensis]|uniref:hypothetical protein n=1 Tax=Vibrio alfacsensis TaxID=1074311 RepID=UPI004068BB18